MSLKRIFLSRSILEPVRSFAKKKSSVTKFKITTQFQIIDLIKTEKLITDQRESLYDSFRVLGGIIIKRWKRIKENGG